jgi:hypothetical protein
MESEVHGIMTPMFVCLWCTFFSYFSHVLFYRRSVPLARRKSHVVGRRDGDITLADDQSGSRRHAVITVKHNIKDL